MEKQETSGGKQQTGIEEISRLEIMYNQISDLELGLLLSGLMILVKDTADYLNSQGIDSETAEGFRLAYLDMLNHDRFYWEKFWPEFYLPQKEVVNQQQAVTLLHGIEGVVKDAGNCQADLRAFSNGNLVTEWRRAPGWHFFKTYSGQRRQDILRDITFETLEKAFCEGKNPYKKPSQDPCKQEEDAGNPFTPVEAVVKRLVGSDRHVTKFWHPVMLYLVVLLKRTDFMTLEDTL